MRMVKNVFLVATIAMITEKLSFPMSMETIVSETNSFIKSCILSIQTIPEKAGITQTSLLKTTNLQLSQRCILYSLIKVRDPSIRVKNASKKFFFDFYCHLSSNSLEDLICFLTCLIFHKSP